MIQSATEFGRPHPGWSLGCIMQPRRFVQKPPHFPRLRHFCSHTLNNNPLASSQQAPSRWSGLALRVVRGPIEARVSSFNPPTSTTGRFSKFEESHSSVTLPEAPSNLSSCISRLRSSLLLKVNLLKHSLRVRVLVHNNQYRRCVTVAFDQRSICR